MERWHSSRRCCSRRDAALTGPSSSSSSSRRRFLAGLRDELIFKGLLEFASNRLWPLPDVSRQSYELRTAISLSRLW
jgi:hypothetical protein